MTRTFSVYDLPQIDFVCNICARANSFRDILGKLLRRTPPPCLGRAGYHLLPRGSRQLLS